MLAFFIILSIALLAPSTQNPQVTIIPIDDNQRLLGLLQPKMKILVSAMAENISHGNDIRSRHYKRAVFGKGIQIKSKIQAYVAESYAKNTINSFKGQMEKIIDNGVKQYHVIRKRSGPITPEQEKAQAKAYAIKISNKLGQEFKAHSKLQLNAWVNRHRSWRHQKRDFEAAKATQGEDLKDLEFESKSVKESSTSLEKREGKWRGFLRKTNKNVAIWAIILGFLLVPIFFGGFIMGMGGLIAVLLWTILFVSPIMNKILFGTIAQARIITDKDAEYIVDRMPIDNIVDSLSYRISKHEKNINHRQITPSFTRDVKSYIRKTLRKPTIGKLNIRVKRALQEELDEYHDHSNKTFSPSKAFEDAKVHALKATVKLQNIYNNTVNEQFTLWANEHLRNAHIQSDNELEKRQLMEKNNKNSFIFNVVMGFLTVPIFANPAMWTMGAMLGFILWSTLFFNPILNKIAFGTWQ